jgi:hypothetical protein
LSVLVTSPTVAVTQAAAKEERKKPKKEKRSRKSNSPDPISKKSKKKRDKDKAKGRHRVNPEDATSQQFSRPKMATVDAGARSTGHANTDPLSLDDIAEESGVSVSPATSPAAGRTPVPLTIPDAASGPTSASTGLRSSVPTLEEPQSPSALFAHGRLGRRPSQSSASGMRSPTRSMLGTPSHRHTFSRDLDADIERLGILPPTAAVFVAILSGFSSTLTVSFFLSCALCLFVCLFV